MEDLIVIKKNDLTTLVGEILEEKLIVFKQWFEALNFQNEKPLTKKEAMEYLSLTRSTFYRYEENGVIPKRSLGDRDYYRRNELDEAMLLTNNFKNLKLVS